MAHRDGTKETAEKIQEETKATIRCIPNKEFLKDLEAGKCMITDAPSIHRVLFAKSY